MTNPHQQPPSGPTPVQQGHVTPPPGYPQGYPVPQQPRQTETTAIVSLVLSVLGTATCGASALAGAIVGRVALRKIRAHPEVLDGEGIAKGGLIVGWIIFGLAALVWVGYAVAIGAAIWMET